MPTDLETTYKLPDLSDSMGAHLGIKFQTVQEGYVKATMPVDARTCQPFGILNGGASLALAEIVAGHGSVPLCSPDQMPCGIQVSANHVRMVRTGSYVEATGRLIHRGRTSHIWNVDITDPEGRLVSTARIVNQIVKKRL
ncbi:PaaI family thioesterase [Phocaeicola sp.]|jgi:1,4-dihydroxy-2-naphthoyl-CoA hydrolase|uniref:PaaI family thioesterase n=1 Tax=Phocaeicola sp. TaxID=2773926 RepID=UPI00386AFC83